MYDLGRSGIDDAYLLTIMYNLPQIFTAMHAFFTFGNMKIKYKIYIIFTLLRYITGYRVRPIPIHAQANAILNVEVPVLTAIDDEVDCSPDGVAWRSKQYSVEIPCQ